MAFPDDLRKAAFDQAELPAAVLDLHGVLALWNPSFERLFAQLSGLGPERLSGSLFDFLESREGTKLSYYAAEVLLGGRPSATVESPLRAADGSRRWLRLVLSGLESPPAGTGQAERFLLCAAEDATERVLREEGLRRAKDEAERATHTKSLFLANMSHEIRTPIQTILGVVELLRETELDTEQAEYASQVGFSADVLLGLINDVLDFSKIEAGRIELETTNFDLRACAYQSVDLLAIEAGRKGLEIVVDIAEDLPSLARGDPLRLRQVIVNLLKNAVKFTREGGARLSIAKSEGGQGIRVTVEDTGPGIPSAARERLFTPFYQADAQSARKSGGTGLGLAISRSIVEAMGGAIGVSAPEKPRGKRPGGEGVAFWFEVPLASPDFTAPPRLPTARAGARLLVVDDHETAREMAASVAARAGYDARTASSGEEALASLREAAREGAPFSLCLIDQSMPRMDGWRLASEITGDTSINAARLILMAGAGEISADAKMRLLRWFNGYLAKPVRPAEMLEALERALSSEVDLESAEAGTEGEGAAGAGRRSFDADVLLAEDHDVNRELFTLLLERSGCRVFSARDGVEAVELSSKRSFDLVLMDIFMPRMSGYEASRAIRAAGYEGPIIAVTASALKGDRDKCAEAGMNGILVKPFKREDLEEALGAALGGGSFAGSIAAAPGPEAEDMERPSREGAAAAAAAGPEVFDWEGVLDTFLGQEATVVGLLGRFIDKAGSQLGELAQALEARDMTRFREVAHSLKGASWNLSARRLGDAALAGETAGKEGDAEAAAWALGEIRAAFEEFAAAAAPYAKGR
jgi:two-component system, sensor histidine kinase and response regulator